ncbi:helix-turn-helix domain-containing protein [Streptomyces microflavus]|uniref:helix-turn-helix domain-containing protein n=1 Tax=Streptomyces microflavus TaxID=1919 RepID=UPI0037F336DD
MSRDAREWVWEHSSSRGAARLIMLSLADRVADEQCVCWASLSSLVKRTGASKSTVQQALDRLLDSGELNELVDLTGPQRSTVYHLPIAAMAVAQAANDQETDSDEALVPEAEAHQPLRISALQRYGIRPREVPESSAKDRTPAGPGTGTPHRKPVHRRAGDRYRAVPVSGTQNRSEPKVNGKYSSGAAAVTPVDVWEVDPATRTWADQQGHLDRLGEEGLAAADAKWRAHRSEWKPRPAAFWAADWRSWIAREHAPHRPTTHNGPSISPAVTAGMTRADAHTAALLAAIDAPAGSE